MTTAADITDEQIRGLLRDLLATPSSSPDDIHQAEIAASLLFDDDQRAHALAWCADLINARATHVTRAKALAHAIYEAGRDDTLGLCTTVAERITTLEERLERLEQRLVQHERAHRSAGRFQ